MMMRSLYSTRARKNDMLKRERLRLTRELAQSLASLGGQVEELPESWPAPRAVYINTLAGRLHLTCYRNWLACRFDAPAVARTLLLHGPGQRLNSHSGKWNFSSGRVSAEEALALFQTELAPILPRSSEA
jgi:hypothetical protein